MKRFLPEKISLDDWDSHYGSVIRSGHREPAFGGPLRRHADAGDRRLLRLSFDNSPAALDLWNFLLTEEDRLHAARKAGAKIVGTMKDLGTVPVIAYSCPNVIAFYPDGAWWIPCFKEFGSPDMEIADSLGIDDSFCPVRAMLGAFVSGAHFPRPDLLTCSVGAVCDDFSAIAQYLNGLGFPILWWEMPHRRTPAPGEKAVELPGGLQAPESQVRFVEKQLLNVTAGIEKLAGTKLTDEALREGIRSANCVRETLAALRETVFTARLAPMPALEMLIAEMLAIHFCSDKDASLHVLEGLLSEARHRRESGTGYGGPEAARLFWVNPVADIKAMNLLEKAGGRICGTDYLFSHALDPIPDDCAPSTALARAALADPMAGPSFQRARRIISDIRKFGAEGLVISKIPGASHCALEGAIIRRAVEDAIDIPAIELEIPSVCDGEETHLQTQIEAIVETIIAGRTKTG